MYDFQKNTMFHQKWILNLQITLSIVLQCFPHDNTVSIHMCDEINEIKRFRRFHKLWSILLWIVQFVHWTWNIRSSNTCQVSALQHNLRAYLWQFSNRFHFFFFEVVVVNAMSWYFIELLGRFVRQLTISFNPFLGMIFHIIGPQRCTDFPSTIIFHFTSRKFVSKTCSVIAHENFADFTLSLSTSQEYMIKERCLFFQINFFTE